jgi:hypothetical protein
MGAFTSTHKLLPAAGDLRPFFASAARVRFDYRPLWRTFISVLPMPKKGDDWGEFAAGIIGAVAGAGVAAASLNNQIQRLQDLIVQWQRHAARLQAERDQMAGKAAFAESQLRISRETESKHRAQVLELQRAVERLEQTIATLRTKK